MCTWIWFGCDIDGLVQDCSNSTANALELLQSWTKPLISECNMFMSYIYQYHLSFTLADWECNIHKDERKFVISLSRSPQKMQQRTNHVCPEM